MKRYLVFTGWNEHPNGGWDDFVASAHSLPAARCLARENDDLDGWYHIIDLETEECVEEGVRLVTMELPDAPNCRGCLIEMTPVRRGLFQTVVWYECPGCGEMDQKSYSRIREWVTEGEALET